MAFRTRHIYYDTDNISETQQEEIRLCRDCSGVFKIVSSSSRGHRIFAVHIPRKACSHCRELGDRWYRSADDSRYDRIFLQDRLDDTYQDR